jgi:hypothetical protein
MRLRHSSCHAADTANQPGSVGCVASLKSKLALELCGGHDQSGCGRGGFVCCVVQEACSFNGAWRGKPSSMARVYYVSSYFWDRALDSGIISDKNAISWKTSPGVSGCRAVEAYGRMQP